MSEQVLALQKRHITIAQARLNIVTRHMTPILYIGLLGGGMAYMFVIEVLWLWSCDCLFLLQVWLVDGVCEKGW